MNNLKSSEVHTPIGHMMVISDEKMLYLLEFMDTVKLKYKIALLKKKSKSEILPGCTTIMEHIENELKQYFNGVLTKFQTKIFFNGTPFQNNVWEALQEIPFGKTKSYSELAAFIGKPTACRAVAQANSANQFPIIVPCHRVININGNSGGYSGGVDRKKWLLNHEKQFDVS